MMVSDLVCVIAAGGKGTRLSSITKDIPKPMVIVAGKPVLQHQIECVKKCGIKQFYFLVGHLAESIIDYFGDGTKFGVNIQYIREQEPLGSSGALYYLKDEIKSDFVFLFGDLMFDVNLCRMIAYHKAHQAAITLLAHPNSHPFDSDLIISKEDLVVGIDSKNNKRNYFYHNLVNSGIYVVSNKILKKYFDYAKKTDFEKDVLRLEIQNSSVFYYRSTEYVKDLGTPDRYYSVCEDVKSGLVLSRNLSSPQKCIFLDRDGTINKLKGFLKDPDDVELENGVIDGLKTINKSKYLAIVITNQPIIARGDSTIENLDNIHKKIETLLGQNGVFIDDLFYCPHHPDGGFPGEVKELKIDCECRKPKIGLLLKAKQKYNIDLTKSYFVGDSTMDIKTGINAGMKTILVETGNRGKDGKFDVQADYIINDLSEIGDIIQGE